MVLLGSLPNLLTPTIPEAQTNTESGGQSLAQDHITSKW